MLKSTICDAPGVEANSMTGNGSDRNGGKRVVPRGQLHQYGFTLLEVMVALAILAIVIGSIMRLQSQTISFHYAAKFEGQAPFLAQRKLAEVIQASPTEAVQEKGSFSEDFPGFSWEFSVVPIESEIFGQALTWFQEINITIRNKNESLEYNLKAFRLAQ
jgi:type II secretion system protein I